MQATAFLAGQFHPLNGQQFIRYSGRWGKTDIITKEPRGPVFQGPHEGVYTAWYNQGADRPPFPALVLAGADEVLYALAGEAHDSHGGPLATTLRPYLFCGAVNVPTGDLLSIGPGVTVVFAAGAALRAAGAAVVRGGYEPTRLVFEADRGRGVTVRGMLKLTNGGVLSLP